MDKLNLLFVVLLFCKIFEHNALAEDVDADHPVDTHPVVHVERKDINDSKLVIKEITSNEPFVNVIEQKKWNFKDSDKNKEEEDELDSSDLVWLGAVIEFITVVIEAALWLIPIAVIFYLYRYREYWLNLLQGKSVKKDEIKLPETLFGLDVREESLPDDIEHAALGLWNNNQYREAISLLYRASLTALFKKYKFSLPSGATEEDCIRQVEISSQQDSKKYPELIDAGYVTQRNNHFNYLTQIWISIAYAHQIPDDAIFNRVCNNWHQLFVVQQKVVNHDH